MTSRDVSPVVSFYATARTAAATGDAYVDMKGYEEAIILIQSDVITDGTAWVFELKECDTSGGSYTAVADADLIPGGPTAGDLEPTFSLVTEDHVERWFGYKGSKRYLRIDLTSVTGSPSSGGVFLGTIIRTKPSHAPTV